MQCSDDQCVWIIEVWITHFQLQFICCTKTQDMHLLVLEEGVLIISVPLINLNIRACGERVIEECLCIPWLCKCYLLPH